MKMMFLSTSQATVILLSHSLLSFSTAMYTLTTNKIILLEFCFYNFNSVTITLPILINWTTALFSAIVCYISASVMIFTKNYMSQDIFIKRFTWIVMLFVLSMNLLIFIPSLATLLLGWDGLGLVSFCLVIYYQNYKSLGAGLMTAFMNRIGDVAILLAISVTFSQGHFNALFMWSTPTMTLTISMILLAGMTKSAQLPFCSWLPAAMAAPTPVSALVHSSTLVTAGVFLLIQFYPFLSNSHLFSTSLMIISSMTMVMAGISANFETDLKKIIALSTLSQLGVMMLSVSLGLFSLALFHLFTHAMFKALLFLCAGNIIHSHNNNQDIRKMSHLWIQMPFSSTCFNIANLALCGFPFMAGFYSKDVIIEMMMFNQNNFLISLNMFLATILTASYSARLSLFIFWSKMTQSSVVSTSDEDNSIIAPLTMLAAGAITSGAVFSWLILTPSTLPLISMMNKLMATFATLTGAAITYKLFKLELKISHSIINNFFFNMWFMINLSNNMTSKSSLYTGLYTFKSLDLGWMETIGGEGLLNKIMTLTTINQKNQSNLFNLFISLTLLSMLFISVTMWFT
uniref:NADH-ubiquinone oxidoreductase chain 5 n=1 Tax=Katharina tunicata TaxID=34587 RepID=Q34843_KATTU|nr:NADH dehydrogenase subunit 5 [Katharina tunicata]AAC48366.1 NADH dehydogenase subunit 5 [Katharina tunicata]